MSTCWHSVGIAGLVDTAAGIAPKAKQSAPSADARKQKSGAPRRS